MKCEADNCENRLYTSNKTGYCSKHHNQAPSVKIKKKLWELANKKVLPPIYRECVRCKTVFVAKVHNQIRCSSVCHRRDAKIRYGNKRRGCELPSLIDCGICGDSFKPFSIATRYCSKPCKSKAKDQRRAFRWKIKRQKIYDRDGGICQLCGGWVDSNLPYPHRKAFTIDHIIPVSAGGTDEETNLQTAHMDCNSGKGVKQWMSLSS